MVEVKDDGRELLRYPAVLNSSKQHAIDVATEVLILLNSSLHALLWCKHRLMQLHLIYQLSMRTITLLSCMQVVRHRNGHQTSLDHERIAEQVSSAIAKWRAHTTNLHFAGKEAVAASYPVSDRTPTIDKSLLANPLPVVAGLQQLGHVAWPVPLVADTLGGCCCT